MVVSVVAQQPKLYEIIIRKRSTKAQKLLVNSLLFVFVLVRERK